MMTELLSPVSSPDVITPYAEKQSIKHWEKNPSPVLKDANAAVQKHFRKNSHVINIAEGNHFKDGVFLAPEFSGRQVLRIGQRRGEQDWFVRGGSAHNVSFGIIEIRDSETGEVKLLNVAVKPFKQTAKGIIEIKNTLKVLDRGFKTVHPICFISEEDSGFLVSVARTDTKTLDSEPWSQFHTGEFLAKTYFEQLIHRNAVLLADLHASGIRHSDPQLKNFWVTPRGNVEGIDWEASTVYPIPVSEESFLTASMDDLPTYFYSLCGISPREDEQRSSSVEILVGTRDKRWQQFNDLFLRFYSLRAFERLLDDFAIEGDRLIELFNDADNESQLQEMLKTNLGI
ncbi:MAG: hypothetical protein US19_C0001G0013 [Candidatus Daviesbacteria bacterium GW2011_GWB1_36_5]|uniref:Protein kinase domain-containing protein n=3 Tax=Candidatus Daviesiibacteriota TaxID=1752718 RepID=A0A0G0FAY5_9BACT|nr:MAG: hypothetical protein US19_C0001G0013 [Candidatus Daviesbacteria bacterium GW2011_GWB1_36_5]